MPSCPDTDGGWEGGRLLKLLEEHYGITDLTPSSRACCPVCGKDNLTMKYNGEMAKCWSCNFIVFHDQKERNPERTYGAAADALRNVMVEFHKELMDQSVIEGSRDGNAMTYLVNGRGISTGVIDELTEIGVVPMVNDLSKWEAWETSKFASVTASFETEAAEEEERFPSHLRSRPKGWTDHNRRRLVWWKNIIDEIMYKITSVPRNDRHAKRRARMKRPPSPNYGRLVMWHTDNKLRPTAIKFWDPKIGSKYRPAVNFSKETRGVFGLSLYQRGRSDEPLLVTEGEMNVLRVQTVAYEAHGGFLNACSTGSSSYTDVDTVIKESPDVIVWADHDKPTVANVRGEGWKVATAIAGKRTIRAFLTPKLKGDPDSWIQEKVDAGVPYKDIFIAISKLAQAAETVNRPFSAVRDEIAPWRSRRDENGDTVPQWKSRERICEILVDDMMKRGRFYYDAGGSTWYFYDKSKRMFDVNLDNQEMIRLISEYGIHDGDELVKQTGGFMKAHCLKNGQLIEPRRFSWHVLPRDGEPPKVYVYNGGDMFRITPTEIKSVPNGTDGILFEHDNGFVPVDVSDSDGMATLVSSLETFKAVVLDDMSISRNSVINRDDLLFLIESWFVMMFFGGMARAKPIMAMIGEPGSGKTLGLAKMLWVLNGHTMSLIAMANDQRDFDTTIMSSAPTLVIDNVDGHQPKWLADRLASLSTGATITMRKLFTTRDVDRVTPDLWLAVTAFSPNVFRRKDIADRMIIVNLDRFAGLNKSEKDIEELVMRYRTQIWAEILAVIRMMLHDMYDKHGDRRGVADRYGSSYRMTTFKNFTLTYAEANQREDDMSKAFLMLGDIQKDFASSADPLYELLAYWVAEFPELGQERNGASWSASREIVRGLKAVASREDIELKRALTPRGFTKFVTDNRVVMEYLFQMEMRRTEGYPTEFRFLKSPVF